MSDCKVTNLVDLQKIKKAYNGKLKSYKMQIAVCGGAGCVSSSCAEVLQAFKAELAAYGLSAEVQVIETGCMGLCAVGPVAIVHPSGTFYTCLTPEKAKRIVAEHVIADNIVLEYTFYDKTLNKYIPYIEDISFFAEQVKIALRNVGVIEHASIDAYIAREGYRAVLDCLCTKSAQDVITEVKTSGLKGRGGAGFPTAIKWQAGLDAKDREKYLVCNADEGDPGAFMDRSILEGDPHTVIEGMIIGGYAIGANKGYIYIRAEYPIAIDRLNCAIDAAYKHSLLGKNIFDTNFCFDLEVRIGAGAFVCGEETALMASIEGRRGEPMQKPPFPFQKGLFGKPTIIDNVETLAVIPAIMLKGGEWHASIGTSSSKGTKVFALAGDIVNTGIIEVPIGTTIGDILFKIGGGMRGKKKFKAVQIGGPSGGCITQENLNTPADYDTLSALGAIMGSGGFIAMTEDTCMVDTARFFMDFIKDESCGKCLPCRIGTKRMLEILERITIGQGQLGDIELLEELASTIQDTAMCGLGQTAPNPILSTIKNFREEYEEHIKQNYCRAGVCGELFISPCENACPANINIPGYLSLIAAGRFIDAYNLIRQENPFPAVCGRICTRPCESKCRRMTVDEAVAICDLKRFVSDYAFKNEKTSRSDIVFPKNGKSVAIIGAGASGLTCAYYLVRIGYSVDVYETHNVAGGVLAFGIPEYRLPQHILEHEVDLIKEAGVNILLGKEIGKDISFDTLRVQYDSIYIATGAQYPILANIPGEELNGVYHGINFLRDINLGKNIDLGRIVAVIGGGNTAIDSARTALRLGAEKVMILYRRTLDAMPAYISEIDEALEEGIEIMELVSPVRFVDGINGKVTKVECTKMQLGDFDKSGRRRAVEIPGSNFYIEADSVIPAISQYSDLPFISKDEIALTSWGTFVVEDDTLMTSMDGVFAGGDVARGPDTVIRAIADGKAAAISIDKYLGGKGKLNKGAAISIPDTFDQDEIVSLKRFPQEMLKPSERKDNFEEVVIGYHKLNAMAEAMRCLHCDRR